MLRCVYDGVPVTLDVSFIGVGSTDLRCAMTGRIQCDTSCFRFQSLW